MSKIYDGDEKISIPSTLERIRVNLVNYVLSRIDKTNLLLVLYIFEVKESISDIITELPSLLDLENLGQLPVLLSILALIAGSDALVTRISVFSSFFMFSRSRNPFFLQFHGATMSELSRKSRSTSSFAGARG